MSVDQALKYNDFHGCGRAAAYSDANREQRFPREREYPAVIENVGGGAR